MENSSETAATSAIPVVTISEAAVRRVRILAKAEGAVGLMLRVSVGGGGCSGFQYSFSFDASVTDDDSTFERDGVRVLIDEVSLEFLAGSEVDYVEELVGAYFTMRNPNAASTCGCGVSFAIG